MVIADQHHVGLRTAGAQLLPVDNGFVGAKGWLKSRRYLRRPLGSVTRISRSTPASACNCASLRRARKLEVVAIFSSVFSRRLFVARIGPIVTATDRSLISSPAPYARSFRCRESNLPNPPQNLTVATTGASGSLFLKHFLLAVERDQRIQTVNFIASDSALRVMAEELDFAAAATWSDKFWAKAARKIHQQANADIGANIASGSYPAEAMVVIPCSVGTLARIANGIASH